MAVQSADFRSVIAGATFSTGDLYKGLQINSSGHAVLPDSTDTAGRIIGTLHQITSSTSAAGVEAVAYQYGPEVQVRMAASTLAAGDLVGFSTAGLGIAPTTDSGTFGVIKTGSSGAVDRIVTVIRTGD